MESVREGKMIDLKLFNIFRFIGELYMQIEQLRAENGDFKRALAQKEAEKVNKEETQE